MVAGAVARMDARQLVDLLGKVAPQLQILLTDAGAQHDPATHAVVPRRLTEAMFYSVRHDSWTEPNARRVLQEMWRKAIEAAEREGA